MKKVFKLNGNIVVEEIPVPTVEKDFILVKNAYSVISTGTEISSLSKTNPFKKINKNNLEKILHIMKQQGISVGFKRVINKLTDKPLSPMGYSSSGEVIEVGEDIEEFK
ncbi:MAG: hypothetical protein PHG59_03430 [Patescibacteria group bacterium]|nr:hypothetical protein [Patescibacteria group bacterium]